MNKNLSERIMAQLNFVEEMKKQGIEVEIPKSEKFDLIDLAAKGNVDAAARLAEGYLNGTHDCEKNLAKAKKWASFAAKKGSEMAQKLLEQM